MRPLPLHSLFALTETCGHCRVVHVYDVSERPVLKTNPLHEDPVLATWPRQRCDGVVTVPAIDFDDRSRLLAKAALNVQSFSPSGRQLNAGGTTVPVLKQRPQPDRGQTTLCLLGGPFVAKHGLRLDIPEGSKRLLIFVALKGGRVNRRYAAGTLWPYGDEERAAGNLRSALWRLRTAGIDILHADRCGLYLDPDSTVDIAELSAWADRIIGGTTDDPDLDVVNLNAEAIHLLPGWYEDWVVFERERLRQRVLHALETLARQLIERRHFARAVDTAMTAVAIEPLRESAQRVLMAAHLAERNVVEARRVFATYRDLVTEELGIPPSRELAIYFESESQIREGLNEMQLLQTGNVWSRPVGASRSE